MMRVNVTLACTETGDRNYITTKNKRTNPGPVRNEKVFTPVEKVYFAS